MNLLQGVKWIVTDIEGTTTEVSFVYSILFPYFRENLNACYTMQSDDLDRILADTATILAAENGDKANHYSKEVLLDTLKQWSIEDRKITPLKELQGLIWKDGFESGTLKGHVYSDVRPALELWKAQGINLAVFSSGSIAAQKLLFKHSTSGDLSSFFSANFDTTTGGKKESDTYLKIAALLAVNPAEILFLSDITEELEAAHAVGFKTLQLIRPGTVSSWTETVNSFAEIQ